jgi:hypothetical protein
MVREIIQMAPSSFWFWTAALSVLALLSLYFAFHSLYRARLIEDTPTSRIRSAHQGYVELIGEAAMMNGEPVIAPLSGTPCCWWRYKVEHKDDKGWRVTRRDQSVSLFLLRDETGECIIDPEGAGVSPSEKSIWYGPNPMPSAGPDPRVSSQRSHHSLFGGHVTLNNPFGGNYRYTEETLMPGDPLYAIGLFKSMGEIDRQAMREELIKEQLRQWKADHASLLKRFDRNRDNQIDLDEWESVRRAARHAVLREEMKEDQTTLHTLSDTDSQRRPLLISTQEEFEIVQQFRLWAGIALISFFVFGASVVWMLTARFL